VVLLGRTRHHYVFVVGWWETLRHRELLPYRVRILFLYLGSFDDGGLGRLRCRLLISTLLGDKFILREAFLAVTRHTLLLLVIGIFRTRQRTQRFLLHSILLQQVMMLWYCESANWETLLVQLRDQTELLKRLRVNIVYFLLCCGPIHFQLQGIMEISKLLVFTGCWGWMILLFSFFHGLGGLLR